MRPTLAKLPILTLALTALLGFSRSACGVGIDPKSLPGVVVDDADAQLTGEWKQSIHVSPFVGTGYLTDNDSDKGEKSVRFVPQLPKAGRYHVLIAYTSGVTRATAVPITVHSADGDKTILFDERIKPPGETPFRLLGTFRFAGGRDGWVTISTHGTRGYVIVDAVQFLSEEDTPLAKLSPPSTGPIAAAREKAQVTVPVERKPAVKSASISSAALDALIEETLSDQPLAGLVDDESFLRRSSYDLIGRQPTLDEVAAFHASSASDRRSEWIDRLLASEEFGRNWANYWADVVAFRVPPPELTYLNYTPLKRWLADELNSGKPWNQVTRELLTASGKIDEHPAATFIGYHQSTAVNLASETSRIFLGLQIRCAQCHDHPFESWTRDQFHELAAFFARTKTKLSENDGAGTVVSSTDKGEHVMPNAADPNKEGQMMTPVFLDGIALENGLDDLPRREQLARFVTSDENPWFAKAFVNRVWSRLLGIGFYEPVDNIGENQPQLLPKVHEALAGHFIASGYDVKGLFRLVMLTQSYRRALPPGDAVGESKPFAAARPVRLRGDEVFATLAAGIDLPNITPPATKPTPEVRFPPPPKSTRDVVADAFGFDPSLAPADLPRTINQAMLMMNNEQLQAQINASPGSGTLLSKLLAENDSDEAVVEQLFRRLLSRRPTPAEREIAQAHRAAVGDRGTALEDLLWSLINSAEFTTKR